MNISYTVNEIRSALEKMYFINIEVADIDNQSRPKREKIGIGGVLNITVRTE